ncbi:MAG: hypothetical protein A2Y57_00055 [Candidatus Woykebacteria bacterium RBG_13_40_7b]|uniref:PAC domain-containing protein n=1 Tax=Candidatus Woykebacteria bacterium RBG_13_40_7b TaxID=1802594 RepID=A0A1G1W6P6_9BACT|nr:MAG: hypothetical protein A2Y57_00055 [Candidatus Woykebacteria bacterium RBG_13_40_7b]
MLPKISKIIESSLYPSFIILVLGSISLYLYFLAREGKIELSTLLQIIGVLALIIIFSTRFAFPKLKELSEKLAYFFEILPIILFIYTLVFSTGGLSSPFLILTHFLALGLAFLVSTQTALSYVFVTLFFVLAHLRLDSTSLEFLKEAPFAAFLYFLAYVAIIPFAFVLARQYKAKEEWVKFLYKQLATSRVQEDALLKNVTDAIFILNKNLEIVEINKATKDLSLWGEKELLRKEFFEVFSLKNVTGKNLEEYEIPFKLSLKSKTASYVSNIQLSKKDGTFTQIDLKILPIIDEKGECLGLILLVKDISTLSNLEILQSSATSFAFYKFSDLLSNISGRLYLLLGEKINQKTKSQLEFVSDYHKQLVTLTADFIYSLRLESGELEGLISLSDVGTVTSEAINLTRDLASNLKVEVVKKGIFEEEQENLPTAPKGQTVKPKEEYVFPTAYALANREWLKEAFRKIIEISLRITAEGRKVKVDVLPLKEIVSIKFFCSNSPVKETEISDLYKKFYGSLYGTVNLKGSSGLEIYIAKNLLEKMGGNLEIKKVASPFPGLLFTATLGRIIKKK